MGPFTPLRAKASYVFMANDHTAVIPENLQCFLKSVDPSKPSRVRGQSIGPKTGKSTEIFNSGAAGYVITRPTLELVERHWGTPPCNAKKTEKWLQGNPGLVLARCLQKHGVKPVDTFHEEEGHRFHAYGPVRVATKSLDDWYIRMNSNLPWPSFDGCASDAISFHYVESAEQRAIYDSVRSDLDEVMERWPKAPSDLGGYSSTGGTTTRGPRCAPCSHYQVGDAGVLHVHAIALDDGLIRTDLAGFPELPPVI